MRKEYQMKKGKIMNLKDSRVKMCIVNGAIGEDVDFNKWKVKFCIYKCVET
jgi:hypothetical protein